MFDTFGPVHKPMYTILFNSEEEVKGRNLQRGAKVFFLPDLAKYVYTQPLKRQKGTDASNLYDEEVGEDVFL